MSESLHHRLEYLEYYDTILLSIHITITEIDAEAALKSFRAVYNLFVVKEPSYSVMTYH
jgi:hypothetical protein